MNIQKFLREGAEGFIIGAILGALAYLYTAYYDKPAIQSIIQSTVSPQPLEKLLNISISADWKVFIAFILVGATIGFVVDLIYTYMRR